MENLNRLNAVLADSGKTNKWLAEQLVKDPVTSASGIQTPHNPIYRHWQRFRNC